MMETGNGPEIGPQQIDAVLRFLPIFEQPGYTFGQWRSPDGQIPYYAMAAEVEDFVQTLYEQQIVQKHERLRAQQWEAERQAEHLFQSLLHRAFRGEV